MSNIFILLLLWPNIFLYLLFISILCLVSPCYYPYELLHFPTLQHTTIYIMNSKNSTTITNFSTCLDSTTHYSTTYIPNITLTTKLSPTGWLLYQLYYLFSITQSRKTPITHCNSITQSNPITLIQITQYYKINQINPILLIILYKHNNPNWIIIPNIKPNLYSRDITSKNINTYIDLIRYIIRPYFYYTHHGLYRWYYTPLTELYTPNIYMYTNHNPNHYTNSNQAHYHSDYINNIQTITRKDTVSIDNSTTNILPNYQYNYTMSTIIKSYNNDYPNLITLINSLPNNDIIPNIPNISRTKVSKLYVYSNTSNVNNINTIHTIWTNHSYNSPSITNSNTNTSIEITKYNIKPIITKYTNNNHIDQIEPNQYQEQYLYSLYNTGTNIMKYIINTIITTYNVYFDDTNYTTEDSHQLNHLELSILSWLYNPYNPNHITNTINIPIKTINNLLTIDDYITNNNNTTQIETNIHYNEYYINYFTDINYMGIIGQYNTTQTIINTNDIIQTYWFNTHFNIIHTSFTIQSHTFQLILWFIFIPGIFVIVLPLNSVMSLIVYLNGIVLSVSGLLWSIVCCIYWIRDGFREYTSIYMSVIVLISVSLSGILVSESILFAVMFWSLFQSYCSYLSNVLIEGIYTSDPSSHTYSNTIILMASGISLGCVLIIRDVYRLHLLLSIYVVVIALTFLHIQIKEFLNITIYMNESIYVSMFFSLLGLHLFHILIGILLIGLILWTSCYSRSVSTFNNSSWFVVTSHQLSSTLQLVYWHFVDLLWIIIYYVLYN